MPYLLFNKESLGRIVKAVGKPIALAPETEKKENVEVAKLLVRVDLSKELPKRIVSGFQNGREIDIDVSYPWLPPRYVECNEFGHDLSTCQRVSNRRSSSNFGFSQHIKRSPSRAPRRRRRSRENYRMKKVLVTTNTEEVLGELNQIQDDDGLISNNMICLPVPSKTGSAAHKSLEETVLQETEQNVTAMIVGELDKGDGKIQIKEPQNIETHPGFVKGNDLGKLQSSMRINESATDALDTGQVHGTFVNEEDDAKTLSPASVDEDPFFLVSRKKSGRKATLLK